MKNLALVLLIGWSASASGQPAQEVHNLDDPKARLSYSFGMTIGRNLKLQSADVDVDVLSQAIRDVLSGQETALDEQQARETLTAFQKVRHQKAAEERKKLAEENQKAAQTFFAENRDKEGVVTLPSGLQYQVIQPGSGDSPKATDVVAVHYRGTLLDGTEFDSSYSRGKAGRFAVNRVIPGWTEALQKMRVGAKWKLFIPPGLAYGERTVGKIGPNSALIFEVELVEIQQPAATGAETAEPAAGG
jgi:FKBP-type peptidyl-prolyl cis-trans isomerase FklB